MKRVLIIDDDPIIGNCYRSRLEKEGCKVEVAGDGQSGWRAIEEFQPDAVLLDLMLPKLSGLDILKRIHAEARFQTTPIVVFTNAYLPDMVKEACAAGATAVFDKASLTPAQVLHALLDGTQRVTKTPSDGVVSSPKPVVSSRPPPSRPSAQPSLGQPACRPQAPPSKPPTEARAAAARVFVSRPPPESGSSLDAEFQTELLQSYIAATPGTLGKIRQSLQALTKAPSEEDRLPHLLEVYRKVHSMTGCAGLAGLRPLSQTAAALEVLLKQLYERPRDINASTLHTVANAIDLIGEIVQKGLDPNWDATSSVNILVVDDERFSRHAVCSALTRAGLEAVSVEDPNTALELAQEKAYDLIFLDVRMPGMDGFELCTKIRALPTNRTTPVIFVTILNDFESRTRSTLSGGVDLIAKPFLPIELSVKALTCLLRRQLTKRAEASCAA